jgi:hypothetical protein
MGVLRTGARRGCDEFYSNFIDGLSLWFLLSSQCEYVSFFVFGFLEFMFLVLPSGRPTDRRVSLSFASCCCVSPTRTKTTSSQQLPR